MGMSLFAELQARFTKLNKLFTLCIDKNLRYLVIKFIFKHQL